MSTTPPRKIRHVYHLSPIRLLIFPGLWLYGALAISIGNATRHDISSLTKVEIILLWIGVLTAGFLPFFAIIWHSRLVLTPEGIAHHQLGYTIRSAWDNLDHISLRPQTQSLVLKKPGTKAALLRVSMKWMAVLMPGVGAGMVGDTAAYAEGRLIMIAPFMSHWKRGPLLEDLRRWAPQLFGADGWPKKLEGL